MSITKKELGYRLRLIRTGKGLTMKEVSQKTSLAISHISNMENGKSTPSLDTLATLVDFYAVSYDDLLGRQEFDPGELTVHGTPFADKEIRKIYNTFLPIFERILVKD